ncbi:MAG: hypothetical protein ACOC2H_09575 [Spirochaetota bacterium]
MKQQGIQVRVSIGTKLIGIISLLIVISLVAMIIVASFFFKNDIELA